MTHIHYETFGSGPPLVMLHGWAMHGGVWRDFARRLGQHYQVISIDLPGHGRSAPLAAFDLAHVSQALLEVIPVQTFTLLGWSMGVTLALALAERCPERIQRLIVLSGNPCFMARDDWPGMEAGVFAGFSSLLAQGAEQTLTRFLALQVNGLAQGKSLLQDLKRALQETALPSEAVLKAGLELLEHSDLRPVIQQAAMPVGVILGARDRLVPVTVAHALACLNPEVSVYVLESAGHLPFLSHADEVLGILLGAP